MTCTDTLTLPDLRSLLPRDLNCDVGFYWFIAVSLDSKGDIDFADFVVHVQ